MYGSDRSNRPECPVDSPLIICNSALRPPGRSGLSLVRFSRDGEWALIWYDVSVRAERVLIGRLTVAGEY